MTTAGAACFNGVVKEVVGQPLQVTVTHEGVLCQVTVGEDKITKQHQENNRLLHLLSLNANRLPQISFWIFEIVFFFLVTHFKVPTGLEPIIQGRPYKYKYTICNINLCKSSVLTRRRFIV